MHSFISPGHLCPKCVVLTPDVELHFKALTKAIHLEQTAKKNKNKTQQIHVTRKLFTTLFSLVSSTVTKYIEIGIV